MPLKVTCVLLRKSGLILTVIEEPKFSELKKKKKKSEFSLWCNRIGSVSAGQDAGLIPGPAQWVKGSGVPTAAA